MGTIQILQNKLTGKINQLERVDLLEYKLQLAGDKQAAFPFQLSAQQENAVSIGLDQYEKGQFVSDEEADKEVSRWLKNVKLNN